jgi:hypothetical protein
MRWYPKGLPKSSTIYIMDIMQPRGYPQLNEGAQLLFNQPMLDYDFPSFALMPSQASRKWLIAWQLAIFAKLEMSCE